MMRRDTYAALVAGVTWVLGLALRGAQRMFPDLSAPNRHHVSRPTCFMNLAASQ